MTDDFGEEMSDPHPLNLFPITHCKARTQRVYGYTTDNLFRVIMYPSDVDELELPRGRNAGKENVSFHCYKRWAGGGMNAITNLSKTDVKQKCDQFLIMPDYEKSME